VEKKGDKGGQESFPSRSYDADNRVTAVQEPFGLALTFSYDSAGNRTLVQDSFGYATTSLFDALDRLTSRQFREGYYPMQVNLSYQANGWLSTLQRYYGFSKKKKGSG